MAAAGLTAWAAWPKPTPPPVATHPRPVHFSDLPRYVYRGEYRGELVRVAFYRPLTPTADPLVWEFHPGEPASVVPATVRIHFAEPPDFPPRSLAVVVGTVEGIDADLVIRTNGVPGVLVLRAARVVPASP